MKGSSSEGQELELSRAPLEVAEVSTSGRGNLLLSAMSADGKYVVLGSADELELWNLADPGVLLTDRKPSVVTGYCLYYCDTESKGAVEILHGSRVTSHLGSHSIQCLNGRKPAGQLTCFHAFADQDGRHAAQQSPLSTALPEDCVAAAFAGHKLLLASSQGSIFSCDTNSSQRVGLLCMNISPWSHMCNSVLVI